MQNHVQPMVIVTKKREIVSVIQDGPEIVVIYAEAKSSKFFWMKYYSDPNLNNSFENLDIFWAVILSKWIKWIAFKKSDILKVYIKSIFR